jgi:hypothetical protein
VTQLSLLAVAPPQVWTRIDIEDPRARQLADRHYSRQTKGAEGFIGPGRRFLFWHEDAGGAAIWAVCYSLDPIGRYQFRNSIFRNESATRSSALIEAATPSSYDVFTRRYGPLPLEPLTSEIDIEATRARRGKERPPGYCYECAGWTWVRSSLPGHGRGARAIYEAAPPAGHAWDPDRWERPPYNPPADELAAALAKAAFQAAHKLD